LQVIASFRKTIPFSAEALYGVLTAINEPKPHGTTLKVVPVKNLLVLAHPEPKSFNAALFHRAIETLTSAGQEVATSDLYAMEFNPVSDRHNFTKNFNADYLRLQVEEGHASETGGFAADIETEICKIEAADLIILHFPLWWFSMPAILKGWVDRVFAFGRTYGSGRMYEKGVFQGKRAMLTFTTGGPQSIYVPGGFNGDIDTIIRPIERGILQFLGFDVLPAQIVFSPAQMSMDEREAALAAYDLRLQTIGTEKPKPPLTYKVM
jgi:NAD(P)H dehydrogenase (quinone)